MATFRGGVTWDAGQLGPRTPFGPQTGATTQPTTLVPTQLPAPDPGATGGAFGGMADLGNDWFAQQGAPTMPGAPAAGGGMPGAVPDQLAQLQQSPGYQFRLGEGLQALQRSAAAKGTLLTGGTLKGIERYGQDYASNEYGQRVGQLYNLASLGQSSAAGQASANQAYGNAGGDLITGAGNAQAAGTVGAANAWSQGIGNATNIAQQYYLARLYGSNPYPY